MKLTEYKKLFFDSGILQFNNGGLSPITRPVHEEIMYWSKRFHEDGFHSDHDYKNRIAWSRGQISQLVDCASDEIALFQSCAWAISQFAFGLKLKSQDEVILYDQEFASNLYPWQSACQRAQAKLVLLKSGPENEISLENIQKRITKNTRVIAISSVQFQTGMPVDLVTLSQLWKDHNILLFVDASQSLGIHPISMKKLGIAGLACGSHKWLNAPVGVGFLAIQKDLAIQFEPIAIGSSTYGECDDASDLECLFKQNAFKFEAGSKQTLEICALGKAVEIIHQVGPEVLRDEAFRIAELIRNEIKKLNYKLHSPFVTSQFISISPARGDNRQLQKYLHDKGVRVPIRGPGVRITPHAFNTDEQASELVEILKKYQNAEMK